MSTGWLPRKHSEASIGIQSSHNLGFLMVSPNHSHLVGLIRLYHKSPETYRSSPIFPRLGNFEVNITYHPSIQSLHRLSVRVEYTHLDLYDLYICTATAQAKPRLTATRLIPGIMQGHRKRALRGFCGGEDPPTGSSGSEKTHWTHEQNQNKKYYIYFIPLCWVFFAIKIPTSE